MKSVVGQGWAFPPTFASAGAAPLMVTLEEDIVQSLIILLGTTPGERPMRPDYGCDLHRYLFEELDDSLCRYLRNLIQIAINRYEPRIELNSVEYRADTAIGLIEFDIVYTVRTTSKVGNIVYPLYLEGGQPA